VTILEEAKRLHAQGFDLLWLRSRSKAPFESGWSKLPKKTWEELEKAYKPGYNLGVRLGREIPGRGYLGVIDCDVKSGGQRFLQELEKRLQELFGAKLDNAPFVISGRGNGSCHYYILTPEPFSPKRLSQSSEMVDVEMGGKTVKRAAWEISFMGIGQQVVLPPSIHPDSGRQYKWDDRVGAKFPLIEIPGGIKKENPRKESLGDYKFEIVDLVGSSLPDSVIDKILNGDLVKDRSEELKPICAELHFTGFNRNQILSVMTDKTTFIGQTPFDHTHSEDRIRAAAWVEKYHLDPMYREVDCNEAFSSAVIEEVLSESQKELQEEELFGIDWRLKLDRNDKGRLKSTLKNVVLILSHSVCEKVFVRDDFSFTDTYTIDTPWGGKKGNELTDDDAVRIKLWLARNYQIEPPSGMIFDAMAAVAMENEYHPVREWFLTLPEWDGLNRLDSWLKKNFEAKGDSEYIAQVFRKFMVACVARIYEPGTKFDWMPILEGAQGIGKSSFPRLLAGDGWFSDWLPPLEDKDAALNLCGTLIHEMGELANFRKAQIEAVKAFLTRTVDKVRPPYGRKKIIRKRQNLFMGTTNKDEYLKDETGNRRFKPVVVGQLNFEALKKDRPQLFAEAIFIFKNGLEETLDLEGSAKNFEVQIQNEKMITDVSDSMLSDLEKWGEKSEGKIAGKIEDNMVRLSDLFESVQVFGKWKHDNANLQNAAKALKRFGYEKYRSSGKPFWRRKK
jgi:hypothetical protein